MKLITSLDKNLFTPSLWIAFEAMQGVKVKDLKKHEMPKVVRDAIIQGLITVGQGKETTEVQINVMTDALIYEIKNNYQGFTMNEIKLAIDSGCKNKLIEITKLTQPVVSLVNLLRFLKLYREGVRAETIALTNKIETERENEVNELERIERIKAFEAEIEIALVMNAKEKESIPMGVKSAYYRHLDNIGRVTLSLEEKRSIFEIAEKIVNEDFSSKPSDNNPFTDRGHEKNKREKHVKELAQAMAFDII